MKSKFIAVLSAFALITAATSCEDAYNVEQPGYDNSTDDTKIFRNNTDIERGIVGLHASLSNENEIEFVSYFTDELGIGFENGGQGINDASWRFLLTPGNDFVVSAWGQYYNIINRCNRLLKRVDDLKAEETDQAEINNYDLNRARLLSLRAYANLKLFSYFTPDYTNPSGLSIIKFDFVQTDDYSRHEPRATVSEIADFIESDVEEALQITQSLGTDMNSSFFSSVNDNAYVNNNFARTILVKLYAMLERDDKVIEYADAVTGKSLGSGLNYILMFDNDNSDLPQNTEIIFRLNRVFNDGNAVARAWYDTSATPAQGVTLMEIGRVLYNQFDQLDPTATGQGAGAARNDFRYSVNVRSESTPMANYASVTYANFKANDKLYIGKFPGSTQNVLQNDIPIFRYADVLLAKAEAYAMRSDYPAVLGVIQELREARSQDPSAIVLPTINSDESAWKAILDERQVEFAFEGHRYLDVKRMGDKAGLVDYFVRDEQDCEFYDACSLPASDSHKLTLPISRLETQANPAIRDQQNPGY